MTGLAPALAHQGGWDEILFVLTPLLIFALLLVLARRRVRDADTDDREDGNTPSSDSDGSSVDP